MRGPNRTKNLWLCLPLAVTGPGDAILTLVGNNITGLGWGWEINPIARWFLQQGALAFGLAFLAYLVVLGTIITYAPLRLSKVLCVITALAHTEGIVSWLHLTDVSFVFELLVYVTVGVITVVAIDQAAAANHRPTSQSDDSENLARGSCTGSAVSSGGRYNR